MGPSLFLDQNEARRTEKFPPPPPYPLYLTVWMTGPLLSQGLDPAMNCALYLDMIMLDNASDSYSTSSPGTMKKPWGRR